MHSLIRQFAGYTRDPFSCTVILEKIVKIVVKM